LGSLVKGLIVGQTFFIHLHQDFIIGVICQKKSLIYGQAFSFIGWFNQIFR